jgi:hypothetical protein
MRWASIFALILISVGAFAATEDAQPRDYVKALDKANVLFLKELRQLVEAKGFRDVRIIPQLFVAKVKGADGKDRTLIINSDTLQAFAFDGTLPLSDKPETVLPELH